MPVRKLAYNLLLIITQKIIEYKYIFLQQTYNGLQIRNVSPRVLDRTDSLHCDASLHQTEMGEGSSTGSIFVRGGKIISWMPNPRKIY